MNKLFALLTLLLVAGVALGDAAPMPAPGFKQVAVDYRITTERDYPDYSFYTVIGQTVVPVKLDSKTPIDVLAKDHRGNKFQFRSLVAVPKDVAKKFAGDKELILAIAADKVEGLVKAKQLFYPALEVKDTEKRDTITIEYKIERLSKDGLVLVTKKDAPKPNGKDSPDDGEDALAPVASAPRGGVWVAALAASLAVMLGGFWLVGRSRRKV